MQVSGGSVYDQFSAFRSTYLVSQIPYDATWTCSFLYNAWETNPATGLQNFCSDFTCASPSLLFLSQIIFHFIDPVLFSSALLLGKSSPTTNCEFFRSTSERTAIILQE